MPIKLIAFDLDGVLAQDPGSWASVHNGLGTREKAKKHEEEFYKGEIDYDLWAKKDADLWKGVRIEVIEDILNRVPLMEGIEETMPKLKKKYRVAILSGGLKILADRVKNKYNIDYVAANDLNVKEGRVDGIRHTIAFNDKGRLIRDAAMHFNIKTSECAAVGDYLNDIPMFQVAGLSIAFNPKDKEVAKRANYVIQEKNLARLLDIL